MVRLVENYMPLRFREIPLFLIDYSFLTPCVYVCVWGAGRGGVVLQIAFNESYCTSCFILSTQRSVMLHVLQNY